MTEVAVVAPETFTTHTTIFELVPGKSPQKVSEIPTGFPVWIHVRSKDPSSLNVVAKQFDLHPLAVEDCFSRLQLPKVEEYEDYTFVVLHGIAVMSKGNVEDVDRLRLPLSETKVHAFIGKQFLITHSMVESPADRVIADLERNRFVSSVTPDLLYYRIVDRLVDEAIPLLDVWENHTSALEDRLMEGVRRKTLDAVFTFRRHLRRVSKIGVLEREVLYALSHDHLPGISDETRVYLRDAHDHMVRLVEYTNGHREALADALDINLALTANRTNKITLRLSVLAVILFPPTIVSGIFGMNFVEMPWIKESWGFWASLFLTIIITIIILFYIYWNKWLEE